MLYIVIMYAAVFIVNFITDYALFQLLYFTPQLILKGEVWRLITWVFIPLPGNYFFIIFFLFFYYFIGTTLENEWGTAKFTIFYIFGILFNILYGFIMYYIFNYSVFIVPNFLNLSMVFAFAVLYPDYIIRLFLVLPIKFKWLAYLNIAYFVYEILNSIRMGLILEAFVPLVAILNFFLFCGSDLFSYLRPLKFNMSKQTINFKKAAKRAKQDLADKPYRHKCSVCGKTDVDNPDLEFRYCSKCNGYHCFCNEHINNHVHFR